MLRGQPLSAARGVIPSKVLPAFCEGAYEPIHSLVDNLNVLEAEWTRNPLPRMLFNFRRRLQNCGQMGRVNREQVSLLQVPQPIVFRNVRYDPSNLPCEGKV